MLQLVVPSIFMQTKYVSALNLSTLGRIHVGYEEQKRGWLVAYLILSSHMSTLLVTSLIQNAGHKCYFQTSVSNRQDDKLSE